MKNRKEEKENKRAYRKSGTVSAVSAVAFSDYIRWLLTPVNVSCKAQQILSYNTKLPYFKITFVLLACLKHPTHSQLN
jgi:hypothetical protein